MCKVILMVSGGADSAFLAHYLPAAAPGLDYRVLHVNHGLRGQASEADQAFVLKLCAELSLPCTLRRADLTGQGNLEQAGRRIRYAAAVELAGPDGMIITAHTLNDRVETFLSRVIHGAGLDTLVGMGYEGSVDGVPLLRPLLGLSHQEITAELRRRKIPWREDLSNNDTRYDRAFIRHRLIPLLEQRNPDFLHTCARTLNALAADNAYIEQATPEPLFTRYLKKATRQAMLELAPDARLTQQHLQDITEHALDPDFSVHLPGGIEIRNHQHKLFFCKAKPPRRAQVKTKAASPKKVQPRRKTPGKAKPRPQNGTLHDKGKQAFWDILLGPDAPALLEEHNPNPALDKAKTH
ncbi:MAG: tRNA lysidine(34) synthetase TilS [Coriobacteriales bacterium]|jgi:tRNA(Ile)-lysidine synthase|nr:tRNA lysidine(34) synthetase TilS [Coriobacteriales bacterium]